MKTDRCRSGSRASAAASFCRRSRASTRSSGEGPCPGVRSAKSRSPGPWSGIDTIQLSTSDTLASTLGLSSLDIGSGSVTTAISMLDNAVNLVSRIRGQFGAAQNRLTTTIANLQIQVENLSAAESRIRDVDVAVETASLTRNSILQQAAISILAQANTQPQAALQLLQT